MRSHGNCNNQCPYGAEATAAVLGIDLEGARKQVSGYQVEEARLNRTIPEVLSRETNNLNSAILASLYKSKARSINDNNNFGLCFGLIQEKRIG